MIDVAVVSAMLVTVRCHTLVKAQARATMSFRQLVSAFRKMKQFLSIVTDLFKHLERGILDTSKIV